MSPSYLHVGCSYALETTWIRMGNDQSHGLKIV